MHAGLTWPLKRGTQPCARISQALNVKLLIFLPNGAEQGLLPKKIVACLLKFKLIMIFLLLCGCLVSLFGVGGVRENKTRCPLPLILIKRQNFGQRSKFFGVICLLFLHPLGFPAASSRFGSWAWRGSGAKWVGLRRGSLVHRHTYPSKLSEKELSLQAGSRGGQVQLGSSFAACKAFGSTEPPLPSWQRCPPRYLRNLALVPQCGSRHPC